LRTNQEQQTIILSGIQGELAAAFIGSCLKKPHPTG
jgi:hypothetical protein